MDNDIDNSCHNNSMANSVEIQYGAGDVLSCSKVKWPVKAGSKYRVTVLNIKKENERSKLIWYLRISAIHQIIHDLPIHGSSIHSESTIP